MADRRVRARPSRLTLAVGLTGVDGSAFKNDYLMNRYGIQINKTSRNTVLFMTNIGTTRSSVAYLIDVLARIANELDDQHEDSSAARAAVLRRRVHSLTHDLPDLPDFSRFHDRFRPDPKSATPEGVTRDAFFLAYDEAACEYLPHLDDTIDTADGGRARDRLGDLRHPLSARISDPGPRAGGQPRDPATFSASSTSPRSTGCGRSWACACSRRRRCRRRLRALSAAQPEDPRGTRCSSM